MKKEYAYLSIAIAFIAGFVVGVVAAVYYEDKTPIIPPTAKQSTSSPAPAAPPADLQKQIDTFRSMLKDDPKNINVLIQLGNLYFDADQFGQAIEIYSRALEIDPKNPDVRTDMGIMYRKKRDYDRAIAEFKKAAEVDPRHANSRYNLGIVLLHDKQDIKGAIKAWEDYLRAEPSGPRADSIRERMDKMKAMVK